MSNDLQKAIKLASRAHKDDKWGDYPYVTHLALTADNLEEIYPIAPAEAAWLHDVIEDHPEYEDKIKEDFPHLYPSLKLLSHNSEDTYEQYITKLCESDDKLALAVKLSDLHANLGNNPPRESLKRRYEKAIPQVDKALRS